VKIIYHCYGGAHSSVTAAAIHLGWLPTDRLPVAKELKQIPYFDRPVAKDHGHIRFMGIDELGNEIYIASRRNVSRVFENMLRGLIDLFRIPEKEFVIVDVMPCVNWKMVLGGFTSRRIGLTWPGRSIIIKGVRYSYWRILSLVQGVKGLTASGNR